MWVWVDGLCAILIDIGLAAAALLAVTALAMVGCRQPARRCSLARAAFLGALALIPLMAIGPDRPRIELIGPLRAIVEPVLTFRPGSSVGAIVALRPVVRPLAGWVWSAPSQPLVRRALTLFYLAAVLVSLAWLVLGWWCSAWISRRSAEPSPETRAHYDALPYAGWWRPRLRVTSRVGRPVVLGCLRPAILIPVSLDRHDAGESLRLSLLHELAHADRGDPWFSLAGSLTQAVWFFLPWVYWMRRQMRLDQEFLADHRAAHAFGPFGMYASSLLDLAAPSTPAAPVSARPGEASFWGAGSALFQRVLMLVRCPYPVETSAPRWWRCALPLLVACGTFLASGLTLRSAEPIDRGRPAITTSQSSQLVRLVVREAPAGPDGWTPPHDLPIALPETFDLSLELWAEPADLPRTRIVGHRLASPAPDPCRTHAHPSWHSVRIRRTGDSLVLQVDGRPIPIHPDDTSLPAWLNVQPAPDRPGNFRNIHLSW